MTDALPWILTALLFGAVCVLWWRDRRRNGTLGNQAQDLARTSRDATVRETDAAVVEARDLAAAAVRRADNKAKEARNAASGDLVDDILDGGGSGS